MVQEVVDFLKQSREQNEIDDILMFANAAGALTATKKGVIPSLPIYAELQQFLRKYSKS